MRIYIHANSVFYSLKKGECTSPTPTTYEYEELKKEKYHVEIRRNFWRKGLIVVSLGFALKGINYNVYMILWLYLQLY